MNAHWICLYHLNSCLYADVLRMLSDAASSSAAKSCGVFIRTSRLRAGLLLGDRIRQGCPPLVRLPMAVLSASGSLAPDRAVPPIELEHQRVGTYIESTFACHPTCAFVFACVHSWAFFYVFFLLEVAFPAATHDSLFALRLRVDLALGLLALRDEQKST